ncbi:hypothetical protein HX001_12875 [Empedobacter brevis]|uniref:Uncharacterized protein n=1 Tax=Empedobacter brevis TaxID=247 RepID=A0AAJ1QG81_9FLAO|nr:tail fiber protein [Empedobacter brevis]MDM1073376.1 hypothetical protein [Empedobacter brevis]
MKKILLSALMAFIGSTSLFAQINTNAFDLSSFSGDLKIRRYDSGDLTWKYALSPLGNVLGINYGKSFSGGIEIYGDAKVIGLLHSENYSSWGKFIGFNTYDAFNYKNENVAHYGLTRIGNVVSLSGWDGIKFFSHGNQQMVLTGGKLGIGTENPDEKLTVKGKIHAEEIIVDLAVPADYVFQKYFTGKSELKADYEFPKLEEVEKFVKENNHLPGIPSAKEIQEKGLKVGEMNNLLLQKIEELTLLLIEQNKKMAQQEERINELETKK